VVGTQNLFKKEAHGGQWCVNAISVIRAMLAYQRLQLPGCQQATQSVAASLSKSSQKLAYLRLQRSNTNRAGFGSIHFGLIPFLVRVTDSTPAS